MGSEKTVSTQTGVHEEGEVKGRIYITEQQWQGLARRIQACHTWAEIRTAMAESWQLLQAQQEQVVEYLANNVNWYEMPKAASHAHRRREANGADYLTT